MSDYIVVIGGANIDIGGTPYRELIDRDSNPGKIGTSIGGVGHNIAQNISQMGKKVYFLTALGNDIFRQEIIAKSIESGIDMSYFLPCEDEHNSTYLFINDEKGDMRIAVSDMDVCNRITPDYLSQNLMLINEAQAIVIDTNIPEESVIWLCNNAEVPIFSDPVSVTKAVKLKTVLSRIHTLKPNRLEAELLSGIKISNSEDVILAGKKLIELGVKNVYISMGEDGVFVCNSKEDYMIPKINANPLSMTGAGDSFMGGLVVSFTEAKSIFDSAVFASAAASITIESEFTINPALDYNAVSERVKRFKS